MFDAGVVCWGNALPRETLSARIHTHIRARLATGDLHHAYSSDLSHTLGYAHTQTSRPILTFCRIILDTFVCMTKARYGPHINER